MKKILPLSLYLWISISVFCQSAYPPIKSTDITQDNVYEQQQNDLQTYYRAIASSLEPPNLALFEYTIPRDTDLLSISANFNLPYDTVGSLNQIETNLTLKEGRVILIPNTPGLFLRAEPETALERLILDTRIQAGLTSKNIGIIINNNPVRFVFFQGERYNSIERAFFLGILFHMPVSNAALTSDFGMREHPIYHEMSFHTGIDLAASAGSDVEAAREGIVLETGYDSIYGNYIIIQHDTTYSTKYGHLMKIDVKEGDYVYTGMRIGLVGTTGLSTGPHLHFEIIRSGSVIDPLDLLYKEN